MNSVIIGQYIQFLRKQRGLTQRELAERLSVTFQSVSKWERGENLPDVSILLDLADILETTTDKILSGGDLVIKGNRNISITELREGFSIFERPKDSYSNEIVLLPLRGMEATANRIKDYLTQISSQKTVSIIDSSLPRFATGDAKAVLHESVRGKDVYIIVDVGNYSLTYKMRNTVNHMSPDDHYQDLIRMVSAIGGKASRVNVVSPLLYSARQDKRVLRESLDCAVALQHLYSIGVSNIMAFDVHDDKVQNATPFMGFDKLMPIYQAIKSICKSYNDIVFNEKNTIVISPDFGGMGRNYDYANELGVDLGVFYKRRSNTNFTDGKYSVEVHKYIGPEVYGKDVLIVDDIIASGETMLDVIKQIKEMGAKRVFAIVTFGFFTKGVEAFNNAYDDGLLEAVFITNASYCCEEIINAKWYREVNILKYIAYYIFCVNSGYSVGRIMNPHEKIKNFIEKRSRQHQTSGE